jgi:hypothetical protein
VASFHRRYQPSQDGARRRGWSVRPNCGRTHAARDLPLHPLLRSAQVVLHRTGGRLASRACRRAGRHEPSAIRLADGTELVVLRPISDPPPARRADGPPVMGTRQGHGVSG